MDFLNIVLIVIIILACVFALLWKFKLVLQQRQGGGESADCEEKNKSLQDQLNASVKENQDLKTKLLSQKFQFKTKCIREITEQKETLEKKIQALERILTTGYPLEALINSIQSTGLKLDVNSIRQSLEKSKEVLRLKYKELQKKDFEDDDSDSDDTDSDDEKKPVWL